MSSYWLLRCPTCHKFTYTDQFGSWKLCPSCGEVIALSKTPIYLETSTPAEAEQLISAVEKYLKDSGKTDLTPEEVAVVRKKYEEWLAGRHAAGLDGTDDKAAEVAEPEEPEEPVQRPKGRLIIR